MRRKMHTAFPATTEDTDRCVSLTAYRKIDADRIKCQWSYVMSRKRKEDYKPVLSRLPKGTMVLTREQINMDKRVMARVELTRLEEELYRSSCNVIMAVCDFAQLDPNDLDAVPAQWVDDYGPDAAIMRHRIARSGWLPPSKAPVAIRLAQSVTVGIMRVRSGKTPIDVHQNVALIKLPAPQGYYEEMELPDEESGI